MFRNISFEKLSDDELQTFNKYCEKEYKYNEVELDNFKNTQISGYFQSYKYFWNYIDDIKSILYINQDKINVYDG
jgi:hypothetical protein